MLPFCRCLSRMFVLQMIEWLQHWEIDETGLFWPPMLICWIDESCWKWEWHPIRWLWVQLIRMCHQHICVIHIHQCPSIYPWVLFSYWSWRNSTMTGARRVPMATPLCWTHILLSKRRCVSDMAVRIHISKSFLSVHSLHGLVLDRFWHEPEQVIRIHAIKNVVSDEWPVNHFWEDLLCRTILSSYLYVCVLIAESFGQSKTILDDIETVVKQW
jgi:hypothetical protein